jgi:hypothetical protein
VSQLNICDGCPTVDDFGVATEHCGSFKNRCNNSFKPSQCFSRKILDLTAELCDSFENRPNVFSYKTLNLRVEVAMVTKPSQTCFVLKIYKLI